VTVLSYRCYEMRLLNSCPVSSIFLVETVCFLGAPVVLIAPARVAELCEDRMRVKAEVND